MGSISDILHVCCERDVPARDEISRAECCGGSELRQDIVYGNDVLDEGGQSASGFCRAGGGDDSVCVSVSATTDQKCEPVKSKFVCE